MQTLKSIQKNWLFKCLNRNSNTFYGKKYNFKKITSFKEYQKNVPIITYEDIKSLIEKTANGKKNILFKGKAKAFETTGGSRSGGKLIPYTDDSFLDFQRAILPWYQESFKKYNLTGNASYFSISPSLRERQFTSSGMEIGVSDERYLGEELVFANSFVVPSWVAEIEYIDYWQIATLYYLVVNQELEFVSIWSPTFLLMLLDILDEKRVEILDILKNGNAFFKSDLNAYKRLNSYYKQKDTKILWQNLKLISCWADGSSKKFFGELESIFSYVNFQPKGLLSTESIVTTPDRDNLPLLTINSGFYEFIDENRNIYFANKLKKDKKYEVVITTNGGLYRYKTADLVKCEGYINTLPILRFQGRVGVVSDMVGEKLTEEFVSNSLKKIEGFCMLIAQNRPNYALVIDENSKQKNIKKIVEKNLSKNPQYAYARKLNQLYDLEVIRVKKPMKKFIEYKVKNGSRVGDIKIPSLYLENWLKENS